MPRVWTDLEAMFVSEGYASTRVIQVRVAWATTKGHDVIRPKLWLGVMSYLVHGLTTVRVCIVYDSCFQLKPCNFLWSGTLLGAMLESTDQLLLGSCQSERFLLPTRL